MLAQTDPVQLLEAWWVVAAVVLPFVYPFFVKAGAAKWFKLVVSLALSVAVAVVSMLSLDWAAVTVELVVNRVFWFVGVVQTVYAAADLLVRAWLIERDGGLNDAKVYRPEFGLAEPKMLRRAA